MDERDLRIKFSFYAVHANIFKSPNTQCKSSFTLRDHREAILRGEDGNNKDARFEGREGVKQQKRHVVRSSSETSHCY